MLHLEQPVSVGMPLSTQVILPVVSAFKQISLSPVPSNCHSTLSQGEDMVTDKDHTDPQVQEVSLLDRVS